MVICTAIFTAFALPAGQGLGTQLLQWLAHAPSSLVSIRSVDEVRRRLVARTPPCGAATCLPEHRPAVP